MLGGDNSSLHAANILPSAIAVPGVEDLKRTLHLAGLKPT